jgi:hypothetical protein
MKKCLFLLAAVVLLGFGLSAQQQFYRLRGQIVDLRTQKPIKRVPVKVLPYNRIVDADSKGSFLFEMPAGIQELIIEFEPFDRRHIVLDLQSDTVIVIELSSPFTSQYIEEVEIVPATQKSIEPVSVERIDAHVLEKLPAMLGERDILKAFALGSGVHSGSEGSSEIFVRGGDHGQNLFLLDGVSLYSTMHALGLISVYNPVTVRTARLYKSAFPAEFGGKISSVVNVITKEADTQHFSGEAEVGLLASKLSLNVPLIKDKLGVQISGRLANYALANVTNLFFDPDDTRLKLHFADLNATALWKVNERNRLRFNLFHNSDGLEVGQDDSGIFSTVWIKNTQQNAGLQWLHEPTNKLSGQFMLYADRYLFDFGNSAYNKTDTTSNMGQVLSGITTIGADEKIRFKINDSQSLSAGLFIRNSSFSPIQWNFTDTTLHRSSYLKQSAATEAGGWAEWQAGFFDNKHQLNAGLRASVFWGEGKAFPLIDPRLSYHAMLDDQFSVSASVTRMSQPVHRIANPGLGITFEIFAPSGDVLKPASSWQYSLGAGRDFNLKGMKMGVKADLWYRNFNNISDFRDGYDVRTMIIYQKNYQLGDLVTTGKGQAYGLDLSAALNHNRWSLTLDYTLMEVRHRFAELNGGRSFAASSDIRNALTLTGMLKLSRSWTFNATWQYQTGRPITIPTAIIFPYEDVVDGFDYYSHLPVYTERNNYRMKDFHKLDLSFQYQYTAFKKHQAIWSFGAYNAYHRANPFLYYIGLNEPYRKYNIETKTWEPNPNSHPVLKSVSVFPVLPYLSWSMKF